MNRCQKCGHIFARRATLGMRVSHMASCDPDNNTRKEAVMRFLGARRPGLQPKLSRVPDPLRRR